MTRVPPAQVAEPARSPLTFFALVFVLSVALLLLDRVIKLQLAPKIPLLALAFLCPVLAAAILVYRERRWPAVLALLARSFQMRRSRAALWLAPALLLMPAVFLAAHWLRGLAGAEAPIPPYSALGTAGLFAFFLVAALGEELGWMGYAIDPLRARFGILGGTLVLGFVWALWHVPALELTGPKPEWLAFWCLFTVTSRVLIVWIYDNAGRSVFAAALFHTSMNLSNVMLGDDVHPFWTAPIVAAIAAVIAAAWLLKRRARLKQGEPPADRLHG
jgi:membrane protease YdiL (CAAX protease family)